MADRLNRLNIRIDVGNSMSSVYTPSSLLNSMIVEYKKDEQKDNISSLYTKIEKNKKRKLNKAETRFIENMAAKIIRE